MKYSLILLVSIFFMTSCKNGDQNKALADRNDSLQQNNYKYEEKIDALVKQYQDLDLFSGVILVAEKGMPVYQKAFGLANRETNISNSIATKFDIGSMNKTFTNVVIMQLIDEGKLKASNKLGDYLKNFPKQTSEKVEIRHLMSHESGYGDYLAEPGFFNLPKSEQTLNKIIEKVKMMPLHFEPGTDRQYSNAGYIVLGAIIESITRKSYYENIKKRIIEPLGLKNTIVDEKKENTPKRAIGYYKNTKGDLFNNEGILMIPTPAGGFISTAEDVMTFYRAYFLSDKLFSEEAGNNDGMLAFSKSIKEKGKAIPIAGGFEGANSVAYSMINDDIFIIVLANMDEPVAEQVGAGIFSIIGNKKPNNPSLKPNQQIYKYYKSEGIEYVKNNFKELTKSFPEQEPKDMILNLVGYDLLFSDDIDDAIKIFKLNTELFPNIANTWDSYGEALLKKGKKEEALSSYKKALEIRPDLPSAQKAVKELSN